jgi:hypothetical protein
MPRTAAEINAEAQVIRQDAQSVIGPAQAQLAVVQQAVAEALAAAEAARNSVDQGLPLQTT